jgi:hypothetical protein
MSRSSSPLRAFSALTAAEERHVAPTRPRTAAEFSKVSLGGRGIARANIRVPVNPKPRLCNYF